MKITLIYPKLWMDAQHLIGLWVTVQLISILSNNNETPAEIVSGDVYLRSEPTGWWISRERSGRCWTGLRARRWGHCPRARRRKRAGRRPPPPLLSPPHPGRRSEAATGERGAAAAAGGVQQRAWREGEQAHRHTEPGAGEPGPAVCVCVCVCPDHEGLIPLTVSWKGCWEQTRWRRRMSWCWGWVCVTQDRPHWTDVSLRVLQGWWRDDVAYFCRPIRK